jgi:hypothetical protein
MSDAASPTPGPRATVGDRVRIITPGDRRGQCGIVVKIIEPIGGDFVYRYLVQFLDGTAESFFGFELAGGEQHQ